MEIGTRIKNLREESGLTQMAFAKILNINNSTLCQYESGDRAPSDDIKGRIADHFQVSMDYLMGRTDIRNQPLVNEDEGLTEYLEQLRTRPEMRMLFSISKGATKEDVEKTVAIIEALRRTEGRG